LETLSRAVRAQQAIEVRLSAPDRELLLVEWLDALIYQMAIRHMLFSRFQVEIEGNRLRGTVWGEMVDRQRHQAAVEIKGATFTELAVRQNADGSWIAQCVVDV
jgi:tRNA nucleotidyltransferase (CCA-adding enzyme)